MSKIINKTNLWHVVILALVCVGTILRTYKTIALLEWTGDSARDVLVAKHYIAFWGQEPLVQPLAASSGGELDNSPLYYLVISFFYFFFSAPSGVVFCFVFLGSMTIILAYAVGRQLINPVFGIVLAFGVTFGDFFVSLSRQIFQPNLLPFFTFLALYLFLEGQKYRNMYGLIASICVGFFMAHLHLSAFAFALVLPLMICVDLVRQKKQSKSLLIIIVITILNLTLWSVITTPSQGQLPERGNFLVSLFDNTSITSFFYQINANFTLIQESIFSFGFENNYWGGTLITSSVILSTLVFIYYTKKSESSNLARFLLLLTVVCLVIVSVHSNEVLPHHLHVYSTLYFVALCCLIWHIKFSFMRWVIFLAFFYFTSYDIYRMVHLVPKYDFESDYQISWLIYRDVEENTKYNDHSILNDVNIYVSDQGECFDFFPHSYWYFLEEITQTKLVSLKANNNNLFQNPLASIGYLVCLEEFYSQQECVARFIPPYVVLDERFLGSVKTPRNTHKYVYRYVFDISKSYERCILPEN